MKKMRKDVQFKKDEKYIKEKVKLLKDKNIKKVICFVDKLINQYNQ